MTSRLAIANTQGAQIYFRLPVIAVRVSGGHLCEAEAPTEPAGETAVRCAAIRSLLKEELRILSCSALRMTYRLAIATIVECAASRRLVIASTVRCVAIRSHFQKIKTFCARAAQQTEEKYKTINLRQQRKGCCFNNKFNAKTGL